MPRPKQLRNVTAARQLRANMSLPEVLLWRELRQQAEVKFRRQHPVCDYVLDFYCAKAKIAIEIDGISHDMGNRPAKDVARDQWLVKQGIQVLRIPASDVLRAPFEVAEALVGKCRRAFPSVSR